MTLKTGNEQLKRINIRIDSLVEDIRTELLAREDANTSISNAEMEVIVKAKLKYIANPLKNFSINGDVQALSDVQNLYDLAIKNLNNVAKSGRYSDQRPLSESEIRVFEDAMLLLKTDKEQGVDVVSEIYSSISEQYNNGELTGKYLESRKKDNSKAQELSNMIRRISQEKRRIKNQRQYILRQLMPELSVFLKYKNTYLKVNEIDEKIKEVNQKGRAAQARKEKALSKKTKEAEGKIIEAAIAEKNRLIAEKINVIKKSDRPRFNCLRLQQESNESNQQYAKRLQAELEEDAQRLGKKLGAIKEIKLPIVESNGLPGMKSVRIYTFGERYNVAKRNWKEITATDIIEFKTRYDKDAMAILGYKDEQIVKLQAEMIRQSRKTSNVGSPYRTINGENPSSFEKWKQRMAFRFSNPGQLFSSRKEVEQAMIGFGMNSQAVLLSAEEKQRQFRATIAAKPSTNSEQLKQQLSSQVAETVFKGWDR